jgi:hypothetical protein
MDLNHHSPIHLHGVVLFQIYSKNNIKHNFGCYGYQISEVALVSPVSYTFERLRYFVFVTVGYEQYNLGVSSSDITIIPYFIKISPAVLVKEPSSGAFIDVPANSLQLTRNRNILQP